MINFSLTEKNLQEHKGVPFIKRRPDFRFRWEKTPEKNLDIIRRGFEFSAKEALIKKPFDPSPEMHKIAEWMTDTEGKGLALIGNSGRGKTLFMGGVLPHLYMAHRKVVHFTKAIDMPNSSTKILLLDEVGREDSVFDKSRGKIDRFPLYVDYCADKQMPLFFTSNISREQFIQRYGEHIFNRLAAVSKIITFKGQSYW